LGKRRVGPGLLMALNIMQAPSRSRQLQPYRGTTLEDTGERTSSLWEELQAGCCQERRKGPEQKQL
ncbi:mCG145891, partial [Mus musculus]